MPYNTIFPQIYKSCDCEVAGEPTSKISPKTFNTHNFTTNHITSDLDKTIDWMRCVAEDDCMILDSMHYIFCTALINNHALML